MVAISKDTLLDIPREDNYLLEDISREECNYRNDGHNPHITDILLKFVLHAPQRDSEKAYK